jgi:hypothetical protein
VRYKGETTQIPDLWATIVVDSFAVIRTAEKKGGLRRPRPPATLATDSAQYTVRFVDGIYRTTIG